MEFIGAHVSTAGGVQNCFQNAERIGANCIQIFGSSPRTWKSNLPTKETLNLYKQEQSRTQINEVFLHAAYLVNLATPNKELRQKSINSLIDDLKIAEALKARGLIFHLGSYKDTTKEEAYQKVADGMNEVLAKTSGSTKLIMENSAGGGNKIGLTAEEIGTMFNLANNDRIKICIDTAHAFGAGILNTYSPEELNAFAATCEKAFGLKNIIVLHINDSLVPFDSKKDRHENIGEGHIGLPAFQNLANHPHFNSIPWILEVPGFQGTGPDKQNIDILKSL